MSSVVTNAVARLSHSSEHAEQVQSYSWPGCVVHGSYGAGVGSSPKGHAVGRVVLLVPEVLRVAAEGQADLVALIHDDVPLVGARLVIVVSDRLGDTGANVEIRHHSVIRRGEHVVLIARQVRGVGAHQDLVFVRVEQHGHFVGIADGAAGWLHTDDQAIAGIDVNHLELKLGHASCHLPGPSCLFTLSLTCDSQRASASPGAVWPHAQPSRLVFSTNICWTCGASAPPPTGWVEL